ncbi:F-box/kelch-repeat protein At3g06240-like [Papaver somniferum]|uniref:F-box/kelch-repeat protein At3g06240-like n=1 Tax=Papaver somniferum TaxID=3469 RepID=UPI000E6FC583|nr:F-box/kelch-repeat protein At3g06240-like [Papaver somniferum]
MAFSKILPVEIALDIFSRVPSESVLDSKLVCTSWNNLLRHPSFSRMHLKHLIHPSNSSSHSGKLGFLALTFWNNIFLYIEYKENHDHSTPIERITQIYFTPPFTSAEFLGSCNGLILLARYSYKEPAPLCICNPFTKEHVLLTEIKRDEDTEDDKNSHWTSGFGYVASTDEYKVVRIMLKTEFFSVYIYTVGSGVGWRNLGRFNLGCSVYLYEQAGIFSDGALHWLDVESQMIVTFNLGEEKFSELLPPPPLPPIINSHCNRIGVVDGFLYFAMYLIVEESEYYDVWLLHKKNGNSDMKEREEPRSFAWRKEFRVEENEVLAVTKSNGVLTCNYNYLHFYYTKASIWKRLIDYKENFSRVFPHKNTLVSLKELGEEDTKIMESVEVKETGSHDPSFNQLQED